MKNNVMRWVAGLLAGLAAGAFLTADAAAPAAERLLDRGALTVYSDNREEGVGNLVTADFLLSQHALLTRRIVSAAEKEILLPRTAALVDYLYADQRAALEKSPSSRVLRDNVAFLAVARGLLSGRPPGDVTEAAAEPARAEWALVEAHAGIAVSPVSGLREDYSQYVPRGAYAGDPAGKAWFLGRLYLSRQGFALQPSRSTGLTAEMADRNLERAQALLEALRRDPARLAALKEILLLGEGLFGKPDDPSLLALDGAAHSAEGPPAARREALLAGLRQSGGMPRIVSTVLEADKLEPGLGAAEASVALRLLPQYYTVDSAVFQDLVFDRVGRFQGKGKPFTLSGRGERGLPRLYDFLAALGSFEAREALRAAGDDAYRGYPEQLDKAGRLLEGWPFAGSLYDAGLDLVRAALAEGRGLAPAAGAYIMNRHNFLLYAKQSFTPVAKGFFPPGERRARADIEACPALCDAMARCAETAALRFPILPEALADYAATLRRLSRLAARRAAGLALEPADVDFLNDLDLKFKALLPGMEALPAVADLHTDAGSGRVLEVGTAYVAREQDGLRGVALAAFEFAVPLAERLDDEAWRAKVRGKAWTGWAAGGVSALAGLADPPRAEAAVAAPAPGGERSEGETSREEAEVLEQLKK